MSDASSPSSFLVLFLNLWSNKHLHIILEQKRRNYKVFKLNLLGENKIKSKVILTEDKFWPLIASFYRQKRTELQIQIKCDTCAKTNGSNIEERVWLFELEPSIKEFEPGLPSAQLAEPHVRQRRSSAIQPILGQGCFA